MVLNFVKAEKITLKDHPEFTEEWLKQRIIEDPPILGLGDVDVKDVERPQPSAGRLDLLLQDTEAGKRYEVELMLGTVNESHIIRCIEYWDVERKRYPQYDHTAVLVAEEITTRFLNVIGLFNSSIPLIAIQLNALKVGDAIVLNFTKVLDEIIPGEDENENEPVVGRDYWEERGSKEAMDIADACVKIMQEFNPALKMKLNKSYVGMADGGGANNFVVFRPKKEFIRVLPKVANRQPWSEKLEAAGIVVVSDNTKNGRISIRLKKDDVVKHHDLLKELFNASYQEQQD